MKEIDLTKTPLSEIDLSRIDYEKSYVEWDGTKMNMRGFNHVSKQDDYWCMDGWHFLANGKNISGRNITLHLFYKDEKQCDTCGNCLVDSIKRERYFNIKVCKICVKQSKWIPIDSVSALSVNPHPIVIEYQDLGDTVKIVKIEGVMTYEEIKKHTSIDLFTEYTTVGGRQPYMYSWENRNYIMVYCQNYHLMKIIIGEKYQKQTFFEIIETMKLASKRLASLIKESKPKIERIEI